MKTLSKLLTLVLTILLINPKTNIAKCHIDDWTALRQLYLNTDGDNWLNNTGWQEVTSSTPSANCNLEMLRGVGLDEQGRVDSLSLPYNELSGSIPAELGNLSNLSLLILNDNKLINNIPAELGNLSNLSILYLWRNELSGSIPPELGDLTNLTELDLGGNPLIGSIPPELGNLNNLTELNLYGNQLNGSIPAELGNLGKLTLLRLRDNQLSGSIPPELGKLTNLIYLWLLNNQLSGSIPAELGNLSSLSLLSLSDNKLTGSIPMELGNLSNLTELSLYNNYLKGSIPAELGSLSNLTKFLLYNNQLSGSIPAELGNLSDVRELLLFDNDLSGSIPAELGNLSNLERLRFYNNNLSGSIPAELGNLSKLTDLYLNSNDLGGNIPAELGNLTNLIVLYLNHNQLSGSIPPELGDLTNLTELSLYVNKLSGNIPAELGNLTSLRKLLLYNNQLVGSIPTQLSNLSNLTELLLFNNVLSGSIPTELANLTNLSLLWLYNNKLTGSIPAELGNLSNLTELRLLANELSGGIPAEICKLTNLTRFEINNNNLQGCYPDCMSAFCSQLTSEFFDGNPYISNGNNFDTTWEEFCATGAGTCTNVYPGDLNHDGIVNHVDVGLLGLYKTEVGSPRTQEHQNTKWYFHPADNWGTQQLNNEDIKHFDCNGDGFIDEDDHKAVTTNMGLTWTTTMPQTIPPPPDKSDYQVMLQPIDRVIDGYLVLNIVLERRTSGDLTLQGGYFSIDYSDISENIEYVTLGFFNKSWLGDRDEDLRFETNELPAQKKIEVGFTKSNNTNSEGSGIIGELILSFDNGLARLAGTSNNVYEFQVNTVGVHNGSTFTPIEDQLLQVDVSNGSCQPNWTITEDTPFRNEYKSNGTIATNGFVLIGKEQQVDYQANQVTLNIGFEVKAGASFKAGYGNCN